MERRWRHCVFGGLIAVMVVSAGILLGTPGTGNTANSEKDKQEALSGDLDTILIDNRGYKRERKGPVEFSHLEHARDYGMTCWDCHHEYKDGENVWVPWGTTQRCSACHDPLTKKDNIVNLQKAYHLNCRNCHKERLKKDESAGPYRECSGCHE